MAKIEDEGWLCLKSEDYEPYPSAWERGSSEPRWMTLIAYARDHAKSFGFISNERRNNWKITQTGKEQVDLLLKKACSKDIDVSRCFFWSSKFKGLLSASYHESFKDAKRPTYIYRDKNPCKDLL